MVPVSAMVALSSVTGAPPHGQAGGRSDGRGWLGTDQDEQGRVHPGVVGGGEPDLQRPRLRAGGIAAGAESRQDHKGRGGQASGVHGRPPLPGGAALRAAWTMAGGSGPNGVAPVSRTQARKSPTS
jgi:hypothetical protein